MSFCRIYIYIYDMDISTFVHTWPENRNQMTKSAPGSAGGRESQKRRVPQKRDTRGVFMLSEVSIVSLPFPFHSSTSETDSGICDPS